MAAISHHWPVYGHDWAVEHLRRGMAHGRTRHAYLIVGPESVGKNTLAHTLAQALNCTDPDERARPCGRCRSCMLIASGNHPDILYSELDGAVLKIEEIRSVTSRIALKPYEARYRVAILRDFDRAQPRAQDALLKTLEEPPPNAVLILLAPTTDSLLSTIVSRSQVISLRPVPAQVIQDALLERWNAGPEQAALLARLSGGRMGWAIRALEDPSLLDQRHDALDLLEQVLSVNRAGRFALAEDLSKDKLALVPLLELWQTYWRDVLLLGEGGDVPITNLDREDSLRQLAHDIAPDDAFKALSATRETLRQLVYNLNLRLALEVMFLDYPGLAR